jgi:hypothetical protein
MRAPRSDQKEKKKIMEIYNYYSDLLLSIKYLFSNLILNPNTIKSFQTNLGNRTFQVDYKPNFNLPSLIINLLDSQPNFYRPLVFQRTTHRNESLIPVLYNKTKQLTLYLQEEHFIITLEAIINTESQAHALTIKDKIIDFLPPNKYFQLYKFITFLNVDNLLLNSILFDVNNDEIINLFNKFNHNKGIVEFCFSNIYYPFVRVDSCNVSIGSTDQRSFQVQTSLTIMNPKPIYMTILPDEIPKVNKYLKERYIEELPVSTGLFPTVKITAQKNTLENYIAYTTVTNYNDPDTNEFTNVVNINSDITLTLNTRVKEKTINSLFNIVLNNTTIENDITGLLTASTNLSSNDSIDNIKLTGPLNGNIINPTIDFTTNTVSGLFNGYYNFDYINKDSIKGSFKTSLISYNFEDLNTSYLIDSTTSISDIYTYSFSPITNSVINNYTHILNYSKSTITKLFIINLNNNTEIEISNLSIPFDSNSNFTTSLTFTDPSIQSSVKLDLIGKINDENILILDDIYSKNSYKISLIIINAYLQPYLRWGAKWIQGINVSFNLDESKYNVIAPNPELSIYTDMFNNISENLSKVNIRNVVLSNSSPTIDKATSKDVVYINVSLDQNFNYDDLVSNFTLYWRFVFETLIIDSDMNVITLASREGLLPSQLKFSCSRQFFERHFSEFNDNRPLYFQIYRMVENI